MPGHPIENIMKTTMENIKEMIDVNTIVGDAVETADGSVIIPISRVSFGFVAGGGEYKEKTRNRDRVKAITTGTVLHHLCRLQGNRGRCFGKPYSISRGR